MDCRLFYCFASKLFANFKLGISQVPLLSESEVSDYKVLSAHNM